MGPAVDDADRAQARMEQEERLTRLARRAEPSLPYCGQCYWCGEPLPKPKRWCDAACRDDWEASRGRRA